MLYSSDGDYFDVYYVKPYCRIGPYLVGMITGYILYRTDCKVYMSKVRTDSPQQTYVITKAKHNYASSTIARFATSYHELSE